MKARKGKTDFYKNDFYQNCELDREYNISPECGKKTTSQFWAEIDKEINSYTAFNSKEFNGEEE